MKIKLLLATVLFFNTYQTNDKILSNYIDKLGWDSFKIDIISVRVVLSIDSNAEKIIDLRLDRRIKRKMLLDGVKSNNAVVIHMILTKMFEPDKFTPSYRLEYKRKADGQFDYVNTDTDSTIYVLNGVSWKKYSEHNVATFNITQQQISAMKKHWLNVLK
jgi:hypothetical protein